MKNVMKSLQDYSLYAGVLFLSLNLSSCSNDDDAGVVEQTQEPTATVNVQDQTLSQNTLIVENVTVGQDSWLVVRNLGTENAPEIVSDPVFVEEGTHENVEIRLNQDANLTGNIDGDDLVVMVHTDDPDAGVQGEYDYNGMNGADNPILDETGTPMRHNVNVTAPSLFAEDNQMVTENNEVTFTSINTARGGWVNLYGQNEDGTMNENDLIGQRYVEAGNQENFTVPFNEGYQYEAGQTIYPRLYTDNPADQQFTYTAGGDEDLPETYGYDQDSGQERFVGNSANTTTQGGFTIGNSGGGTTTGTGTGA